MLGTHTGLGQGHVVVDREPGRHGAGGPGVGGGGGGHGGGDAELAGRFAARLLDEGVYATAFSFPVVPTGTARIRTQMNASHTGDDLDAAVAAFVTVGRELGVVS